MFWFWNNLQCWLINEKVLLRATENWKLWRTININILKIIYSSFFIAVSSFKSVDDKNSLVCNRVVRSVIFHFQLSIVQIHLGSNIWKSHTYLILDNFWRIMLSFSKTLLSKLVVRKTSATVRNQASLLQLTRNGWRYGDSRLSGRKTLIELLTRA